mgnify:FL=1
MSASAVWPWNLATRRLGFWIQLMQYRRRRFVGGSEGFDGGHGGHGGFGGGHGGCGGGCGGGGQCVVVMSGLGELHGVDPERAR